MAALGGGGGDERASLHFHVANGVTLGAPTIVNNRGTKPPVFLTDAGDKAAGYTVPNQGDLVGREVKVSWPILTGTLPVKTEYTLMCRTYGYTSNGAVLSSSECSISGPKKEDRFHVTVDGQSYGSRRWDVRIADGLMDRRAEASGSITTDGSVSLDMSIPMIAGGYTTESVLHVDGADVVPVNTSTQFDAVLFEGEETSEPDTARMKFKYAIRDASAPVGRSPQFYVRGSVSNKDADRFRGGASCEVIDYLGTVVEDSGYTCTMDGYYAGSVLTAGRAHYITDFTIGKKK